jgi:hypothetical protein
MRFCVTSQRELCGQDGDAEVDAPLDRAEVE